MKRITQRLCISALVGALYATISMLTQPISFGPVQFRVAEAFSILPLFFPETILGLTIGCLIANLFGNGILDLVFGTLGTLLSAIVCYAIGRMIKKDAIRVLVGSLPAILFNAIIVPFTFLALSEIQALYWMNFATVLLGQAGVIFLLGVPLYVALKPLFQRWKIISNLENDAK